MNFNMNSIKPHYQPKDELTNRIQFNSCCDSSCEHNSIWSELLPCSRRSPAFLTSESKSSNTGAQL